MVDRKEAERQSARLVAARKHAGFDTAKEAADVHHWNYNTYKAHESNSNGRGVPVGAARRYGRAYQAPPGWILTGDNPPSWAKGTYEPLRQIPIRPVPKINFMQASRLNKLSSVAEIEAPTISVDADPTLGPRVAILELDDDSMVPLDKQQESFPPGTMIVVDPDAKWSIGDYVIGLDGTSEGSVFRRLDAGTDRRGKPTYELVPLNRRHRTIVISQTHPERIIAKMVRSIRKY